jgi:RNA polymerase sigma-70 factor (ECF subfamily)
MAVMTDVEAFEALATGLHPRLYRLAARVIGRTADAEDIVQDALLRAFRSMRRGAVSLAGLNEAVLVTAVTRLALNHLRDRSRATAREEEFVRRREGVATMDAAQSALRELDTLLMGLPPDQRAAFVLKELEGFSLREIGTALGCSEAAAAQRVSRARQFLRSRVAA